MLAYERLVESSRVVRDLTAKLRQDRGVAASNLVAICGLERELAEDFWRRGKYSESRTLLMDAWSCWRGGGAAPLTRMSSRRMRVVSWISGGSPGTSSDTTRRWSGSSALRRCWKAWPTNRKTCRLSFRSTSATNDRLAVRSSGPGRIAAEVAGVAHPHARAVERACRGRSCDRTPRRARASGPGPRCKARAQRSAPRWRDFRQIDGSRNGWQMRLAEWIARDIQPYPSDPKSTGKPQGRLDPDVHARAVIRRSIQDVRRWVFTPPCFPPRPWQVCGIALGRAAEQRKAGRLDDARWTAASLFAFGKMLARRDPNEAVFHVVLCEAFEQEAKNAWKVEDFPTIEAATRNALVAACTALRLDPRNTMARIRSRVSRTRWSV